METSEMHVQFEEEATPEPQPAWSRRQILTTVVVGLAMLVIGMVAGYLGRSLIASQPMPAVAAAPAQQADPSTDNDADPASGTPSAAELMAAVVAQTRHFKGDVNAPVTIIEFADFQCPFCGRFVAGAGRQIDEIYLEKGLVRIGYQHYAFLGPESQWAAEASECAAEQGAFWEYHDLLYEQQAGENQGAFNKDNLKQFAADLGLDRAAFNTCLDSSRHAGLVSTETAMVQSLGVRGTPAFLINGRALVGAQPFEAFQQVIEAELKEGQ